MIPAEVRITRVRTCEDCTENEITLSNSFDSERWVGYGLELPWKDNQPYVSRIKAGKYVGWLDHMTAFGDMQLVRLEDKQDRTGIFVHPANWTVHPETGRQLLQGCIAPGKSKGECAVWSSVEACEEIAEYLGRYAGDKSFVVIVEDNFPEEVKSC